MSVNNAYCWIVGPGNQFQSYSVNCSRMQRSPINLIFRSLFTPHAHGVFPPFISHFPDPNWVFIVPLTAVSALSTADFCWFVRILCACFSDRVCWLFCLVSPPTAFIPFPEHFFRYFPPVHTVSSPRIRTPAKPRCLWSPCRQQYLPQAPITNFLDPGFVLLDLILVFILFQIGSETTTLYILHLYFFT